MSEGSKPIYGMKVDRSVYVKMRDGIRLACDIYRPDADGRFPALLSMSPFGKEIQLLNPPSQPRAKAEWGTLEAGHTEFWVSRGYAHVINDVRGSAGSEWHYCRSLRRSGGAGSPDLPLR